MRRGWLVPTVIAALPLVAPALAMAQTATPTPTATETASPSPTPSGKVIDLTGDESVVFVAVIAAVFALLWFTLLLYDRMSANRRLAKHLPGLLDSATRQPGDPALTVEQFKALAAAIRQSPIGGRGLTRSTLALGLLTLVLIALLALLVGDSKITGDLLKTVVTALTTALTTVVGFYFGARTVADKTDPPGDRATPAPAATAPTTTPGAPTNVRAAGGGPGQAEVSFTPPAVTGTSEIKGYVATADPSGTTAAGTGSPLTVTGLDPGTAYTFVVQAQNDSGLGAKSKPSEPVKPA